MLLKLYTRLQCEGGQTITEYALLVGGLALGCIAAMTFLSYALSHLFQETAKVISQPSK